HDEGVVWLLFLTREGRVRAHVRIGPADLSDARAPERSAFGESIVGLGDLDGDGIRELAVGGSRAEHDGRASGAIWVLFLREDGTVRRSQKIASGAGGFTGGLRDG